MKFADLFTVPVRKVRKIEKIHSYIGEKKEGIRIPIIRDTGTQHSAPSAPIFVPLDEPFRDGGRYRFAGACEIRTRLDLFFADPAGPWLRTRGTLVAVTR